MALNAGDINAISGMSKAVFDQLDLNLMTQEEKDKLKPEELEAIRNAWKKLAYSISQGLTKYLVDNLEIFDVKTKGTISPSVSGDTGVMVPSGANHVHNVNLTGAQADVVFTQSNNGTGRVR